MRTAMLAMLILAAWTLATGCNSEPEPVVSSVSSIDVDEDGFTGDEEAYLASLYGGTCGDGSCDPPEDCKSCPGDCGGCCGNGSCEPPEDCKSCPGDCGSCCGDGKCEPPEDCTSCSGDCGPCQ